jgi:hypothetical protein
MAILMKTAVLIFLGAAIGSVLWSFAFRAPDKLYQWMLEPFGRHGPVSSIVAFIFSATFFILLYVLAIFGLAEFLSHHPEDPSRARHILIVSSLGGFLVLPLLVRLEMSIRKRRGTVDKRREKRRDRSNAQ